ncbi:Txe/YoeB family addiction module toxin [Dyella sp. LX-66]|uniref:Txe/YoeB family addiction module toxin n=1 Tax=unclassified Dyella TaxID=2634549 RepID=UPI001BE0C8F2|nr:MULTISPECIES: Txe/YoeB family addiction module toxin [unclassified Dyella]MBT2119401.1 Txe/YoeB family addiction module toxin [Dyella sp. LX-1]MBT2138620.1 Txe/YoeB family addiction module toxin [Dyella sp. LX-66]
MARSIKFTDEAWKDYQDWAEDKKTLKKIHTLIKEAQRTPNDGLGDPHPLSGDLTGFWSRSINMKDRLVYAFDGECIFIISCKFHYGEH